jgi:7TMR-DISM extracellular 2
MNANPAAATVLSSLQKVLHAVRMTLTMALATGLLAALVSPAAWSRTVLDLDTRHQPVLLQDWGDYWIDPGGQLSPQQVSAATNLRWQPTQRQTIYPLTTGQALWIRFSVPPAPGYRALVCRGALPGHQPGVAIHAGWLWPME